LPAEACGGVTSFPPPQAARALATTIIEKRKAPSGRRANRRLAEKEFN